MKCAICGAEMRPSKSDLPFKITEQTIVILKSLPILQCENCPQYLIEDSVMGRVVEILAIVDGAAELEVIRYAAKSKSDWPRANHRPASTGEKGLTGSRRREEPSI